MQFVSTQVFQLYIRFFSFPRQTTAAGRRLPWKWLCYTSENITENDAITLSISSAFIHTVLSVNSIGNQDKTKAARLDRAEFLWYRSRILSELLLEFLQAVCFVCPRSVSYLPVCQRLLTITPGSGRVAYPYVIRFCQQRLTRWAVSRRLDLGMRRRRRSRYGTYPSPCLSSSAPPFPSLAFPFFSTSSFLLSHDLRESFKRCGVPKWDDFSPFFILSLSLSLELTEKKSPKPHCWVTHSNNCCF